MTKSRKIVIIVLCCAIVVVAFIDGIILIQKTSTKRKLIGTWDQYYHSFVGSDIAGIDESGSQIISFKEDNTFVITIGEGFKPTRVTGTYKIDKDKLILKTENNTTEYDIKTLDADELVMIRHSYMVLEGLDGKYKSTYEVEECFRRINS